MHLQQLRYLCAIFDHGFNITRAAEVLHTSQPGVSKQIRELERELGGDLLLRDGRRILGPTELGQHVLRHARRILSDTCEIHRLASDLSSADRVEFAIGCTHVHARYLLPPFVERFHRLHPAVQLKLLVAAFSRTSALIVTGDAKLGISSEPREDLDGLAVIPFTQLEYCLIAPRNHFVTSLSSVTLAEAANFPLVSYDARVPGAALIRKAFARNNLNPLIAVTAMDAEVIKTYVKRGLGLGIIPKPAYEAESDGDIVALALDDKGLCSTVNIIFDPGIELTDYLAEFVRLVAPDVTANDLEKAIRDVANRSADRKAAAGPAL
jgi:DNA-binding transcriptional LysR family regulator